LQDARYALLSLCLIDIYVTTSSDISILTSEPRNSVQSVASIRDWLQVRSCRNFPDVMCLCFNRTSAIHAHYEVYNIFPSFLYRPIPLSTVYHSHMDTLLLRCMNNGQSILSELLELVSVLCQITTKAHVTSVQISKFFHFTFSLPSLSYLYLTKVFGRTFATRNLCYGTSF
jgi:hypothetical protein